jgi:hypothetical protein
MEGSNGVSWLALHASIQTQIKIPAKETMINIHHGLRALRLDFLPAVGKTLCAHDYWHQPDSCADCAHYDVRPPLPVAASAISKSSMAHLSE